MKLTDVHFYPTFVRDTLRWLRDGRPPIAGLANNAVLAPRARRPRSPRLQNSE